ncbi:hypothetical protein ACFOHS_19325 [Jhaorihella thermophila]
MTTSWGSVRFDHSAVTGSCSSCHNGVSATGKPHGHFQTTLQCDECHRTTGWGNASYTHSSGAFPAGHSTGLDCTDCHRSNSASAAHTHPAYRPDCAGCHANEFRPDKHKKYEKAIHRLLQRGRTARLHRGLPPVFGRNHDNDQETALGRTPGRPRRLVIGT